MKKEKKEKQAEPEMFDVLADALKPETQTDFPKEYAGLSLSDIYHYETIKQTKTERRNAK